MKNRMVLIATHPITITIVGLACISGLIWYMGPLLGVASHFPLASTTARAAVTAILLGAFALRQSWRHVAALRRNAALLEQMSRDERERLDAVDESRQRQDAEAAEQKRRLEQAVATLRRTRIGAPDGRTRWRDRLSLSGRRFLYELPWYVFIGAPGSGKTTALMNAGLRFPLADDIGAQAVPGVGGTRSCDWWFTDEAVMIDTAGRYMTQDSDAEADRAAWTGFLQLLKKYRPRRPLNGVLLTVSVSDLLRAGAAERDRHAARLRARLAELREGLGIQAPVYVMVTKTDLVAGFAEVFQDMTAEQRAQVWGVTLPMSADAPANQSDDALADEMRLLQRRLDAYVMARLATLGDATGRAAAFAFPQQVALLLPLLRTFLQQACAPSATGEVPLLRGVYFTSGTQEGTPIDRVVAQLARTFRVSPRAVPQAPNGGRSYFLTRLLREVVFAEGDLGGLDARHERRAWWLRVAAFSILALGSGGALAAWGVSAWLNRAYVAEVAGTVQPLAQKVGALEVPRGGFDAPAALALLDAVHGAARTDAVDPAAPTVAFRAGLFQGDKLQAAADRAYETMLPDVLLPGVARALEERLAQGEAGDAGLLYEALKVYLMLFDATHYDAKSVRAWAVEEWERTLPPTFDMAQRQRLVTHLDAALSHGARSNLVRNAALVEAARGALARQGIAARVYAEVRRAGAPAAVTDFTLVTAAGPSAPLVLERTSGTPLTRGVPALFTFDGYTGTVRPALIRTARRMAAEEPWVLGIPAHAQDAARVAGDARGLYLDDYIRTWDAFLADVKVVRPTSLQKSIELTRLLSQPDSPLVRLLRGVARETTLMPPAIAAAPAGREIALGSRSVGMQAGNIARRLEEAQRAASDIGALAGAASQEATVLKGLPDDGAERAVDEHFANLRELVAGSPAPIDQTRQVLAEYNTHLVAVDAATRSGATPPGGADIQARVTAAAGGLPPLVRDMVNNVTGSADSQAQSAAIENWRRSYRTSVGELCAKAIQGRYPFARGSRRDVARDDFAQLFAPGGLFDDFFQKQLGANVDITTRPWRFRRTDGGQNPATLGVFQQAAAIRDAFFHNGARVPSLRLDMKLTEMAEGLSEVVLDVDGQSLHFAAGSTLPVAAQWPGPNGGSGVRMQAMAAGAPVGDALQAEGPWALWHLLDSARIEGGNAPEKFHARFELDGRTAVFEITAGSVQNPFRMRELERFSCAGL